MAIDPLPPGTLLCVGAERRHRYKLSDLEPTASGYALVYRAHDRRLGCDVRIKEVACEEINTREPGGELIRTLGPAVEETHRLLLHRFEHEVRALGRVFSGRVVRTGDFWREWGTAYCTLDERPGWQPLSMWRPPQDRSRWEAVRPIATQLLEGLAAIHAVGLIQADIRPETVAVDPSGQAAFSDLGHARTDWDLIARLQASPWPKDFAPPELHAPKHGLHMGPWSDLYSWALLVYGMMVGHPTPTGRPVPAHDRYQAEAYGDAAETLLRAGLSESWANAVHRCLLLDPDRRPHTVGDVEGLVQGSSPAVNLDWEAIAREAQESAESIRGWSEQVVAELEATKARAAAAEQQASAAERRTRRWIVAAALLVLAMMVLAVVLANQAG